MRPELSFHSLFGIPNFSETGLNPVRVNDMVFKQKSTRECIAEIKKYEPELEAVFSAELLKSNVRPTHSSPGMQAAEKTIKDAESIVSAHERRPCLNLYSF